MLENYPNLFAAVPLLISAAQAEQMRAVIEAVERVVALPQWQQLHHVQPSCMPANPGVFFGYDFHLNADGAQLIEINTNAGGAFFNARLLNGQPDTDRVNLEQVFLNMFRHEWQLQRGDAPLRTVAIVDESPPSQYFYPEFVLAKQMFERAGITAFIAGPDELQTRSDGLYCGERKVDLVYNRLTDFSLQHHPALRTAYQQDQLVLTPHPRAYRLYADKRNLVLLTDNERLRSMGADESTINILQTGIPQTRLVASQDAELWWRQRKQWFFKPATGFGGKGSYRGANLTKRVFQEIMQGNYVAQRMAPPGERMVCVEGAVPAAFKFDVRCYVYDGQVQLIAARLYQGQTTNFRTPGGGFAAVRVVS